MNPMLIDQIKTLLREHNLGAKKGLGQNFLVDEKALDTIAGAADLSADDHVVEVGPGTGFLTERLIQQAGRVTAVEYDAGMVRVLQNQFPYTDHLTVVHKDALKFPVPAGKYKVVANIPYYITSPLLKHFLQSENRPSLMVLLVQKEVAEKICGIGGKSMVTIQTQLFGQPSIAGIVRAASFYPAPQVDSAILKIQVYPEPLVAFADLNEFLRLVGFGFSQKRKKLTNSLAAGLHLETAEVRPLLERAGIRDDVRAENLEIEDWQRLLTESGKLLK